MSLKPDGTHAQHFPIGVAKAAAFNLLKNFFFLERGVTDTLKVERKLGIFSPVKCIYTHFGR